MSRQFNRIPCLAALCAIAAATATSSGDPSLPPGLCWDIETTTQFTDADCTIGYICSGQWFDIFKTGTTWLTVQSVNQFLVACEVFDVGIDQFGNCVPIQSRNYWQSFWAADLEGVQLCPGGGIGGE